MNGKQKNVRIWLKIALGVVVLLSLLLIKAKNGWNFDPKAGFTAKNNDSISIESIMLPQTMNLYIDKSERLMPELLPKESGHTNLKWRSSDTTIAKVDSLGVVYAQHKVGDCKVTVSTLDGSGLSAETLVFVKAAETRTVQPGLVGRIDMEDRITLQVDNFKQVRPTVFPEDAARKDLAWSSSNPKVATVSNGLIRGIAEGTAVIIAYATDASNTTAQCTVKVISGGQTTGLPKTDAVGKIEDYLSQFSTADSDRQAELINTMMRLFARDANVSVIKDGVVVQRSPADEYFRVISGTNLVNRVRVVDVKLDSYNRITSLYLNECFNQ